jgi:hypothetical protein
LNPQITLTEEQVKKLMEVWEETHRVMSPEEIIQIVIDTGLRMIKDAATRHTVQGDLVIEL